jgi:hypothetical protein
VTSTRRKSYKVFLSIAFAQLPLDHVASLQIIQSGGPALPEVTILGSTVPRSGHLVQRGVRVVQAIVDGMCEAENRSWQNMKLILFQDTPYRTQNYSNAYN